jgi:hypothetical protein
MPINNLCVLILVNVLRFKRVIMNSYMHWPTTLLNKIADVTQKSILTKFSTKLPLRMTYYHQCNGLKPWKKIFIGTHAGGSQVMELVAHGPK